MGPHVTAMPGAAPVTLTGSTLDPNNKGKIEVVTADSAMGRRGSGMPLERSHAAWLFSSPCLRRPPGRRSHRRAGKRLSQGGLRLVP